MIVVVLALLSLRQEPEHPRDRIRMLLEERLPDVDPLRRDAYVESLARTVPASMPAARREALLGALPDAVGYHALVAGRHAVFPAGHSVEPSFMLEGLDVQMEYLGARMSRWSRNDPDAGARDRIRSQVDGIAAAAAAALGEKLPGEPARRWIEGQTEILRKAWTDSLELPLQAFLDRPLSDAELAGILSGIRDSIHDRPISALGESDFADPAMLAKKGATALLREVREAAFGATALCFGEFEPFERRAREWEEQRRARADAARGPAIARPAPRILARASERPEAKRDGPRPTPTTTTAANRPEARADASSGPTSSSSLRSPGIAWAAAAVVILALAAVLLARRPKSAGA